jgi:hypothetical protein
LPIEFVTAPNSSGKPTKWVIGRQPEEFDSESGIGLANAPTPSMNQPELRTESVGTTDDSASGPDTRRVPVPSMTLSPSDPLYAVQAARIQSAQDYNAKQAAIDASIASATNLVQTTSPVTGTRQWVVKPTQ